MVDTTIMIISIFVILFIIKRYDVLRIFSYKGRVEKDFKGCYIISYPKFSELHNKGETFNIDIDEFFELNPKLKGKIPIEKRVGLASNDPLAIELEIKERIKIDNKYSKVSKQKNKKKRENV